VLSPTTLPYSARKGIDMKTPSDQSCQARLSPVECQKPPSVVRG
jgi:hypothetical protein